jgi:hypothetical protein
MMTVDRITDGVVWKFELRPWSVFMDVPEGATLLSVGAQRGDVVVWALCDPEARKVRRLLAAHPTGVELPRALRGTTFVGTAQMDDGLVFHVFDGGEQPR